MPSPRRSAWAALAGLIGSLALTAVAPAAPAAADEVVARPVDGVFRISGHGWGHGRGMSQWGAQGAASRGVSAEQIVSTYYPGTARAVLPSAPIRVLLSGDEGRDTEVVAAPGLTVSDAARGRSEPLPTGVDRWRVTVDAAGLHLQGRSGGTWRPHALGGATTTAGPLRFDGPGLVRVALPGGSVRDYRGTVSAVRASASALQTVVALPLEDYLLGVVPRESSPSWRPAALEAQAIAARSYSAHKRARVAGRGSYDICDTTTCQVFGGTAVSTPAGVRTELEHASTTAAVRATAGVVRTYGGVPILAEFSSSNGGWSTAGHVPYLRAARDDWDGALPNRVHSWTASLPVVDLERAFPAVGTLQRLRVTTRDGNGEWGGRVRTVVLEGVSSTGAATRVTTTGAGVYAARRWPASRDGLRSSWWRVVPTAPAPTAPTAPAPPKTAPPVTTPPVTPPAPTTPPARPSSLIVASMKAPVLGRSSARARTGTLYAAFRNTGRSAWPLRSLQVVRTAPAGGADPLAPAAGAVRLRPARTSATSIAPGETVTLTVALDAARVRPGTYARAYQLRLGTGPGFGVTARWQVTVRR